MATKGQNHRQETSDDGFAGPSATGKRGVGEDVGPDAGFGIKPSGNWGEVSAA
ncbi:MAG: hypothetical protein JWP89_5208 [Schlesneria sp.]|nr:hypothetical protein [Schlesneria sp.]